MNLNEKYISMKILYICGTYAPGAYAGSELSAHELLRQLNNISGVEVLVASDQRYSGGQPSLTKFDGVTLQGIRHEDRHDEINSVIVSYKPDVILTQLLWSDIAISAGANSNVPTVLRIPSKAKNLDILSPTALVANSRFICNWVKKNSGRDCHYIFSTIDLERVVASPSDRNPQFITMFNPIKNKGGQIFREIAQSMPDREFAVVPGWHSLRSPDGSWDRKVIERSLESQNAQDLSWRPEDIDFSDVSNVLVLKPTMQVANIFAKTRLLLVPSQYEETLARVSVEAFANGIPVIGSRVGGLQEHVGKAGYLVDDYSRTEAWVSAIEKLDDPELYAQYSDKALAFIREDFSNSRTAEEFMRVFREVIGNS
jgi:glycosyltransferase involved in cell wall biosynthesis